jgi:uncharacterized membrane protein YfcA
MGIILGMIGAGGSILTVPILVYIVGIEPVQASSYSLFIVGVTASFGVAKYLKSNIVDIKAAVIFSIPSLIGVFLTRTFILPFIPDIIISLQGFEITKSLVILILFAILMIFASFSMIKKDKSINQNLNNKSKYNYLLIFVEGSIVGILTGFVGAGGGFLIIPALVVLANIPMKQAIGTSIVIIAVKSLIGFGGDIIIENNIEWDILLIYTLFSIVGMLIGTKLTQKMKASNLKKGFGYFVLIMGIFIILKETLFKNI